MEENKRYCLIYALANKDNGKIYIGQTWQTFKQRMGSNGIGYYGCWHIYNALQLYGLDRFVYSVLEKVETQEEADDFEMHYIFEFNTLDPEFGYNIKIGGGFGLHTQEWKDANSIFMIDRHKRDGHPMQGKHHTEEAKAKISAAQVGKIISQETIEKRRKTRTKTDLDEVVVKAYQDNITIKEICSMFDIATSRVYRILHRKEIPLANNFTRWTGKTHTEETKTQMSNSAKELWSDRKNK